MLPPGDGGTSMALAAITSVIDGRNRDLDKIILKAREVLAVRVY